MRSIDQVAQTPVGHSWGQADAKLQEAWCRFEAVTFRHVHAGSMRDVVRVFD